MTKKQIKRYKDLVISTPMDRLEALKDSFAISDMNVSLKGLFIEAILSRQNSTALTKLALIENSEYYGDDY